jgi:hypothetical protein
VKNLQVQLVRPPVTIGWSAGSARERALGNVIHISPPVVILSTLLHAFYAT